VVHVQAYNIITHPLLRQEAKIELTVKHILTIMIKPVFHQIYFYSRLH